MRIVHVIQTLHPSAGGPPAVAMRLAAAQAAMGHSVRIVSIAESADERKAAVRASMEGIPDIERIALDGLSPADVPWPSIRSRAVFPEADVLHLHGVWEPILLAASRWARTRSIPYAVVPHGMLNPWSLSRKPWKKRLALALGWRKMLDRAAFLHALNADERAGLSRIGLTAPVEIIPNGIFLEEIHPVPAPGSFRPTVAGLGAAPYILFLSRLHVMKGVDRLAAAFVELARRREDVHLVVAGPDDGERPGLERTVRDAGLESRIHVVGPVYGTRKYAAIADAACFCLPSRNEGFSMAITEALALARPVVISEACHFPEVAEAGAGVVADPEPVPLAEALLGVLSDPEAAAAMGNRGAELVRERYTWGRVAERTLEAYARVGASTAARSR
jgi:glycosyltransferase involved in cell wall biosynthesis